MTDPTTNKTELSVLHSKHGHDNYSIIITTQNAHVSLSSHPYPHCPGNRSSISIFDLTPEDVLKLGNLITAEAFQIKGLQEAGSVDKEVRV